MLCSTVLDFEQSRVDLSMHFLVRIRDELIVMLVMHDGDVVLWQTQRLTAYSSYVSFHILPGDYNLGNPARRMGYSFFAIE